MLGYQFSCDNNSFRKWNASLKWSGGYRFKNEKVTVNIFSFHCSNLVRALTVQYFLALFAFMYWYFHPVMEKKLSLDRQTFVSIYFLSIFYKTKRKNISLRVDLHGRFYMLILTRMQSLRWSWRGYTNDILVTPSVSTQFKINMPWLLLSEGKLIAFTQKSCWVKSHWIFN